MQPAQAIHILEMLMDGVNPVTGEVLSEEHVCLEPQVMRALHTAIMSLDEQVSNENVQLDAGLPVNKKNGRLNAGREWTDSDKQQLRELYLKGSSMDDICDLLQRRYRGVKKQLIAMGLFEEAQPSGYLPALKEQYPNAGKPWSKEENQWMMAAWRKGASVEEMAAELGRTPKAICCRLENNGIWADYSPSEDEPPRWTAADTQNMLKMVAEGYSISRIAERFHRTEKAIEARLFYLGLTKKAPNLFGKEK